MSFFIYVIFFLYRNNWEKWESNRQKVSYFLFNSIAMLFELLIMSWFVRSTYRNMNVSFWSYVTIVLTTLIQHSTRPSIFVFMGTPDMWSKHILTKLYKIISIASHKITNIIVCSRRAIATNKQLRRICFLLLYLVKTGILNT
jgi:hypothetical protein